MKLELDTNDIRFGTFTTRSGERRIYINGTTREKLWWIADSTGKIETQSDAIRPQPNTSSVSKRREKDYEASTVAVKAIRERMGLDRRPTFEEAWSFLSA